MSELGTRSVREAVFKVIDDQQPARDRGWGSSNADSRQYQGGSLRLGRLYFEEAEAIQKRWRKKVDAFTLVNRHLKQEQDVFRPHYVFLGRKGRIGIYERYDIVSNIQLTQLWQRDMKAKQHGEFLLQSRLYQTTLLKSF